MPQVRHFIVHMRRAGRGNAPPLNRGLYLKPVSESVRDDVVIAVAEAFVDAFYSFDPDRLRASLESARNSQPAILFYQGWAEGENYAIVNRIPCKRRDAQAVSCSITVDDDLINALGIDFDATDTFLLTFSDARIVAVETESDDPQEYYAARARVRENRRTLIEEPCRGYFDGGPTPEQCVQAMIQGFTEFVASDGR